MKDKNTNINNTEPKKGFWQKVASFFGNIFGAIGNFFAYIFAPKAKVYINENEPATKPEEAHRSPETRDEERPEETRETSHEEPSQPIQDTHKEEPKIIAEPIKDTNTEEQVIIEPTKNEEATIESEPKDVVVEGAAESAFIAESENSENAENKEEAYDYAPPPTDEELAIMDGLSGLVVDDIPPIPTEEIVGGNDINVEETTAPEEQAIAEEPPQPIAEYTIPKINSLEDLQKAIKGYDNRAVVIKIENEILYVGLEIEDESVAIAIFNKNGELQHLGKADMDEGEKISDDTIVDKAKTLTECPAYDINFEQAISDIKTLLSHEGNNTVFAQAKIEPAKEPEQVETPANKQPVRSKPKKFQSINELVAEIKKTLGVEGNNEVSYDAEGQRIKIAVSPDKELEDEKYIVLYPSGECYYEITGMSLITMKYGTFITMVEPSELTPEHKNVIQMVEDNAQLFAEKTNNQKSGNTKSSQKSIADEVLGDDDRKSYGKNPRKNHGNNRENWTPTNKNGYSKNKRNFHDDERDDK